MGAGGRCLRSEEASGAYLCVGADTCMVVPVAGRAVGEPIPTSTIRIDDPRLDETEAAMLSARRHGTEPIVVNCGADEVLANYPRLIEAAEGPVIDTSCTALLMLAEAGHYPGCKVALSGDGSDAS